MEKENIGAVIFARDQQGIYTIFGPSVIFESVADWSDIAYVARHDFHDLPTNFLDSATMDENANFRSGEDFGLESDQQVVFLPWALLPTEFNLLSSNNPAQQT